MINKNMNIRMNIMQIQRRIDYFYNTDNTEPGIAIETYSEELQDHVGNKVEIQPEDIYDTYSGEIYKYVGETVDS